MHNIINYTFLLYLLYINANIAHAEMSSADEKYTVCTQIIDIWPTQIFPNERNLTAQYHCYCFFVRFCHTCIMFYLLK